MGKQIITFAEIVVETKNFIVTKDLLIDDVNINKIKVSNKVPFRKKHFFLERKITKLFFFLYKTSYYIAIYYCIKKSANRPETINRNYRNLCDIGLVKFNLRDK